jgi:hypothetical protein
MPGEETGSEQEGPLPHRHERPCEDAQGVGVGTGGPGVSGPRRGGRDDARAARSASRFGYQAIAAG